MKTWVRKSISVGVMAAGGLLVTQAAAQADVITTGNFGVGNGTQVVAPVQTVVDVCGNSVGALAGAAFAGCEGGATATNEGLGDIVSAGNFGVGNGTQIVAPVQTVLDVCGNAIAAGASAAFAGCDGGADATIGDDGDRDWDGGGYYSAAQEMGAPEGDWQRDAATLASSGNFGVLNGTQIYAPIQTSINICGNSVAAVLSAAFAGCEGGADATLESARAEESTLYTGGNYGVLNGTQVYAPVQTVVDVCGNAVAIGLSAAFAGCEGGADATIESASNEEALPALNNLPFVAGLPVIGSLGQSAPSVPDVDLGQDARTAPATEGYDWDDDDNGDDDDWDRGNGGGTTLVSSGNFGVLNGTQVFAPVQTVVDVSGNAISLLGSAAFAGSNGGAAANQ